MIVAINYSNEAFKKAKKLNSFTAKIFGRVDKVISYGPNDIDKDFRNRNSEILSLSRGNGYWLWKPYFIKTTLDKMNDGEFLIYTDAGMCYLRKTEELICKMESAQQDIFLTETPLIEVQFTHPEVIKKLDAETFKYTNQIQGGLLIVKKTEFTRKFIDDWLILCQDKELLVADNFENISNDLFISHREDQSILSILAKKYGIKPFMDVSDYGRFPIQCLNINYLFRLQRYDSQHTFNKSYFLLFRKSNPLIYLIKYVIKRGLSKIGFANNKLINNWAMFRS